MAYDLGDGPRYRDRERGLRGQDLVALSRKQSDLEVDDSTFDARAPYVNPKAKHPHRRQLNGPGGTGTYNLVQRRLRYGPTGGTLGPVRDPKELADDEWRSLLSPEQYTVLRRAGTEPPWSGAYVHNHEDGSYRCAGCGSVLFDSSTKFDSGSGWPSFTEPAVADAVELRSDKSHGMARTEVVCRSVNAVPETLE